MFNLKLCGARLKPIFSRIHGCMEVRKRFCLGSKTLAGFTFTADK